MFVVATRFTKSKPSHSLPFSLLQIIDVRGYVRYQSSGLILIPRLVGRRWKDVRIALNGIPNTHGIVEYVMG